MMKATPLLIIGLLSFFVASTEGIPETLPNGTYRCVVTTETSGSRDSLLFLHDDTTWSTNLPVSATLLPGQKKSEALIEKNYQELYRHKEIVKKEASCRRIKSDKARQRCIQQLEKLAVRIAPSTRTELVISMERISKTFHLSMLNTSLFGRRQSTIPGEDVISVKIRTVRHDDPQGYKGNSHVQLVFRDGIDTAIETKFGAFYSYFGSFENTAKEKHALPRDQYDLSCGRISAQDI